MMDVPIIPVLGPFGCDQIRLHSHTWVASQDEKGGGLAKQRFLLHAVENYSELSDHRDLVPERISPEL
jgi:hypothetical protein